MRVSHVACSGYSLRYSSRGTRQGEKKGFHSWLLVVCLCQECNMKSVGCSVLERGGCSCLTFFQIKGLFQIIHGGQDG